MPRGRAAGVRFAHAAETRREFFQVFPQVGDTQSPATPYGSVLCRRRRDGPGEPSCAHAGACMPMQVSTSRMALHVANRLCGGNFTRFSAVAHACLPMNRAAQSWPWIAEAATRQPVVRCCAIAPAHDTDFVVGSLCGSRSACRGQHA